MNNVHIALLIGGLVALGGGYLAYQKFFASEQSASGTHSPAEAIEAARGTFASMLARGQDLRCEVSYDDGVNISDGVIFMAGDGERIRADIDVKASAAGPMRVSMIRIDGYNHVWGSYASDGVKVKVDMEDRDKLFTDDSGADFDENTEFSCASWSIGESVFALPTDVTFVDFAAEMSAGAGLPAGDQCGLCDQVPAGSAQDQCRAAFSC